MSEQDELVTDNQAAQRDLVERVRPMPGVAEVLDLYGKLTSYTTVITNVQPSQVKNATSGNIG